mmetsp:Transcript_3929/g.11204  ORF Transcript_3929/g.11204 Transcript_3929/m.11204 type:complete len:90 (+) Transcript_3929:161-430(+)|eukprot:175175-Chlamydomonas_euryale.AAC.6
MHLEAPVPYLPGGKGETHAVTKPPIHSTTLGRNNPIRRQARACLRPSPPWSNASCLGLKLHLPCGVIRTAMQAHRAGASATQVRQETST